jgi:radical SAM protein with 4Fe4S-binding SPASM domain
LDDLSALKVDMFAATGGEPLLRRDLLEVLSYAYHRGLKTGVATNGFLIDHSMAERIKDANIYSVQISLDGLERTHNRIRNNRQSFARAVSAVRLLIKLQIPLLSVATTATTQNISEIGELRHLLLKLKVKLWRLTMVMPIGRAQSSDVSLDSNQLISLFRFIKENDRKGMHIYLGENLTFLGDWEKKIRGGPMICPIGFLACCIGVDGNVRGCPEQPDTVDTREGSLLESSFAEIWQNGFKRYRNREILTADPHCAECKSKVDCYGGCWVMRGGKQHCIYRLLS